VARSEGALVTATTSAYRSNPGHEWRARQRPESVSPPARAPQPEPDVTPAAGTPAFATVTMNPGSSARWPSFRRRTAIAGVHRPAAHVVAVAQHLGQELAQDRDQGCSCERWLRSAEV
jgi:hypothetical protein